MKHSVWGIIRQFLFWFFGSPFRELPSEFGDPVPAELRVFEYRLMESHSQASYPTLEDYGLSGGQDHRQYGWRKNV